MFDRKKYKDFAKIQLKDRWLIPLITTLIILVITRLLSLPDTLRMFNAYSMEEIRELYTMSWQEIYQLLLYNAQNNEGNVLLGFLLSIFSSIVQFVLLMGVLNVFLKMSRSPEPITFSAFIEGLSNWKKGILMGLWQTLWIFLWMLLAIPIASGIFLFLYFIFNIISQSLLSSLTNTVSPIILFIGMIPGIIRTIAYSQCFFIVAEYPSISVRKALKLSIQITNGYKWNIFKTYLSFLGWFFLSFITLGILDLFVTPYYRMTMTNVYHALVKNALEEEIIKPEDFA